MPDQKPSPYYKLRIRALKFISAVDAGAQGPVANVALIKRALTGTDVEAVCRVVKTDEKLGLVFGWALASSLDGGTTPHVDLQKDAIIGDDDLIKVAAAFMESGGPSDVLHDENPDGKIVFALPVTKDVAAALGIKSDVHGLAIAMRPSPETFQRFLKKELNAFSIGGSGERELVMKAQPKCPSCGTYGKADDKACSKCGSSMAKALWSTAEQNKLPDASFLYVESGGTKDDEGKTTPRSLRHFPYKNADGEIDLPHLRNAIARIPQSDLGEDLKTKLQDKAEKLLEKENGDAAKRGGVAKYNPDQERDDHGRFGSGGGGGGGGGGHDNYEHAASDAHGASEKARSDNSAKTHAAAAAYHSVASNRATIEGNHAAGDMHARLSSGHAFMASAHANHTKALDDHEHAYLANRQAGDAANERFNAAHAGGTKAPGEKFAGEKFMDSASRHTSAAGDHARASMAIRSGASGRSGGRSRSKKRASGVAKQAVLTSSDQGHQHQLDLDDPADPWFGDKWTTGAATMDGADQPHTHALAFDPQTGKITIGEDSGHSHTVDAVVPPDVLRQAALNEDGERCNRCGQMCDDDCKFCPNCGCAMGDSGGVVQSPMSDEDSKSGAAVVVIAARAPDATPEPISTPSGTTPTVKSETKEPPAMTTELTAKIRELEVENSRLTKLAQMTDAQRAHFSKLATDDQATFINLTPAARQGVLDDIAKADTVVYKSLSGHEYRKSDDLRMIELAQATDAATKMAQNAEVEKRNMEFEKRGNETLPHFAKGVKGNLRGRIMKALNGEFSDPAEYEEAIRCFKAADYALGDMEKAKGVNPHLEPTATNVAQQELEHKVNEFAKRNNMPYAAAFVQATATDPEIRKLYNQMQLGN